MPISLCIVIKNEENNLKQFLNHHNILADEIIIVDTGSLDNSIEIAKRFTDKIYEFKWNDDFSQARNFSISKASKSWIIWLDPDERIEKRNFEKIKELAKKDYHGISFLQKTKTQNKKHPRYKKGFYSRRICKMFRNNLGIKFEYPVHETVFNSVKGSILKSNIIIHHFPSESKEKSEYYLELLKKKKQFFPDSNALKEINTELTFLNKS